MDFLVGLFGIYSVILIVGSPVFIALFYVLFIGCPVILHRAETGNWCGVTVSKESLDVKGVREIADRYGIEV